MSNFYEIKYRVSNCCIEAFPTEILNPSILENKKQSYFSEILKTQSLHDIWRKFESDNFNFSYTISTNVVNDKIIINFQFVGEEYNIELNLNYVNNLTNKFFDKIFGLGDEVRINILSHSGIMSILPVPNDDELKGAYLMWLYNYVTFVFILKKNFNIDVVENETNCLSHEYLALAYENINKLYLILPKQLKYYCSLAQGIGYHILIYGEIINNKFKYNFDIFNSKLCSKPDWDNILNN